MLTSITPQLSMKIESILSGAIKRAEAKSIYLCDKGGNIVAQFSEGEDDARADNISALAAGSFFATQELARLIGEGGFHCVFHQGGDSSVYMQSLESEMLLLVVFGKESNPGLVRLYVSQAAKTVDQVVAAAESASLQEPASHGVEFKIDETAQPFTRST